jgi:hypothetical protein
MNQKIMKITKTLLFFAIISLASCEKDLYENLELQTKTPFERKFLNAKQLPAEFQNYISQNGKDATARSSSNSDDFSNAIFTPYDIISMTDDKNITNYSISFFYEDTPKNVFYNLVINVSPTGQSSKNIFKYICNPADFENFKSHNFDFKYFVGMTEISTVANNSTNKLTSKSNSGDDECPKIYIASSSDSGSSSGSGGPGDSPASGGFNTSVPGYNSPGYTGSNSPGPSTGSDDHGHSECYGSNGLYWYHSGDVRPPHKHTGKMASDCPEVVPPTGYVPVNTAAEKLTYLKSFIVLDRYQLLFLSSNPDILNLVYKYIYNSDANEEDRAFAVEMINALKNGDKVDLTYKVIVDKSLTDNPNLYGVYTKLGEAPAFQTYLQKFDSKFSVANLKLSVDNQFKINQSPDNWTSQAITLTPTNHLINIIVNNDASLPSNIMKFPKIISPVVLVHEMMHAEINRILLTCSNMPHVNPTNMTDAQWVNHLNNLKNNFSRLYEYYVRYQLNTVAPTGFQHEYIAQKYRNVIKEALIQYDNNQHPEDFYNTLSWFGLKGTTAWNNLSQAQRDQINVSLQNIYQNEPYFN